MVLNFRGIHEAGPMLLKIEQPLLLVPNTALS